MPKIYINPSNQTNNPCKMGDSEANHMHQYADYLEIYLKANNFEYKRNKLYSEFNNTLAKAVADANAWKPDIYYSAHSNASANGNAVGSRPHLYKKSGENLRLANCIMERRKELYKGDCTAFENPGLYELNATTSIAVLDEVVFHDNTADAKFFHDNMKGFAKLTVKAFCDYFKMTFIDPDNKVLTTDYKQKYDSLKNDLENLIKKHEE